MDFNNGLIIIYGYFNRGSGAITNIKNYTGTFPTSFLHRPISVVGVTGTANGVVGIATNAATVSTIPWSMKPNHDSTSNNFCYYIAIGY